MWVEDISPAAAPPQPPAARGAPRLFVVANPGSGANDSAQTRQMLERVFREAGRPAAFADVSSPAMLARAFALAAAQAREEGGVLVGVGGDGTINTAAQAALAHRCPLGVIPQGTFNLLARDQGIPVHAETAARALLGASPRPMQVGFINGQVFHLNASLGLYPQLLQDREAFNAQFGRHPWVAAISALVTLFQWRRQLVLDVELDGHRTALTTPMLFVANNRLQLERIGLDEDITANLGAGRLVGLASRPIGGWAMLGLLLRGALGRLGEAGQVRSFSFQRLEVRVRGRRRVKVSTDGEVRVMIPPLSFSVAPQPLMLMVPAEADRAPRE
ncbi:MAG TPA: diacylglycerol kinase family protein [Ramlibacter sp.]|nr:diacylglycerol kinase family protein [Ramlibacter sp.]